MSEHSPNDQPPHQHSAVPVPISDDALSTTREEWQRAVREGLLISRGRIARFLRIPHASELRHFLYLCWVPATLVLIIGLRLIGVPWPTMRWIIAPFMLFTAAAQMWALVRWFNGLAETQRSYLEVAPFEVSRHPDTAPLRPYDAICFDVRLIPTTAPYREPAVSPDVRRSTDAGLSYLLPGVRSDWIAPDTVRLRPAFRGSRKQHSEETLRGVVYRFVRLLHASHGVKSVTLRADPTRDVEWLFRTSR